MEVKIVLGYGYDGSGIPETVQWLCKEAVSGGKRPIVVRFTGGPQAKYTLQYESMKFENSTFGSGVLQGIPTMLLNGFCINPINLVSEFKELNKLNIRPTIFCDTMNKVITPYDISAEREKVVFKNNKYLSLYPTFEKYNSHCHFTHGILYSSFPEGPDIILDEAVEYHKYERREAIDKLFKDACAELQRLVFFAQTGSWKKEFDVLIFEGCQGLLTDVECGFHPSVYPFKTGLNAISSLYLKGAEVYLTTSPCEVNPKGMKVYLDAPSYRLTYLLNRASERHRLDNYVSKYGCKMNLVVNTKGIYCDRQNIEEDLLGISGYLTTSFDKIYYSYGHESNTELWEI